ncbi:hypothetical protein BV25DRAFT_1828848 [Artomyces pyxidatus]|uniref:Uncharacterized protein n=1 Tax=Artomyces pyxidatus TaxID=48021 RepID=A0ACB8SSK5_9AGAM|nr:hypothetical protein BV25DRAFT_1828848 [Artomyces pyxidatus]
MSTPPGEGPSKPVPSKEEDETFQILYQTILRLESQLAECQRVSTRLAQDVDQLRARANHSTVLHDRMVDKIEDARQLQMQENHKLQYHVRAPKRRHPDPGPITLRRRVTPPRPQQAPLRYKTCRPESNTDIDEQVPQPDQPEAGPSGQEDTTGNTADVPLVIIPENQNGPQMAEEQMQDVVDEQEVEAILLSPSGATSAESERVPSSIPTPAPSPIPAPATISVPTPAPAPAPAPLEPVPSSLDIVRPSLIGPGRTRRLELLREARWTDRADPMNNTHDFQLGEDGNLVATPYREHILGQETIEYLPRSSPYHPENRRRRSTPRAGRSSSPAAAPAPTPAPVSAQTPTPAPAPAPRMTLIGGGPLRGENPWYMRPDPDHNTQIWRFDEDGNRISMSYREYLLGPQTYIDDPTPGAGPSSAPAPAPVTPSPIAAPPPAPAAHPSTPAPAQPSLHAMPSYQLPSPPAQRDDSRSEPNSSPSPVTRSRKRARDAEEAAASRSASNTAAAADSRPTQRRRLTPPATPEPSAPTLRMTLRSSTKKSGCSTRSSGAKRR